MRRFVTILMVALAGTLAVAASAGASVNPNPGVVFRPGSHPYGIAYSEWATDWLEWAFEAPSATSPILHPDNCGPGESSKVWFLAASVGGTASATCTVPAGKGLLVSPQGAICSPALGDPAADLLGCALAAVGPSGHASVTVDGVALRDVDRYLVTSRRFRLQLPADNIFGVPARSGPAVGAGLFLLLHPLHAGTHTISIALTGPTFPGGVATVNYSVRVLARAS